MDSTVAHRLRLRISYDGTDFHGWAAQPGLRTVEGVVTGALNIVTGGSHVVTVAGRTDAGVHARGQVAHVDLTDNELARAARRSNDPCKAIMRRLSALFMRESPRPKGGSDLAVTDVSVAPEGFDARFSALSRTYTYRVCDDPSRFDPLRRRDVLWVRDPLDVEAMNNAAAKLIGEHDFISYCKPRDGATTIRELLELRIDRKGDLIEVTARADAFCHSMVRTLVGSLLKVGAGQRDEDWPARRLEERSRNGEVIVAPPHPLTLESVEYPDDSLLAARARTTRAVRQTSPVAVPARQGAPSWGLRHAVEEDAGVATPSAVFDTRTIEDIGTVTRREGDGEAEATVEDVENAVEDAGLTVDGAENAVEGPGVTVKDPQNVVEGAGDAVGVEDTAAMLGEELTGFVSIDDVNLMFAGAGKGVH